MIQMDQFGFEDISEPEWHSPGARLLGNTEIGGALFHVEAIAVTYQEHEGQTAVDGEVCEGILSEFYVAAGGDGPFATTKFDAGEGEREYVVFLYPFSR